MNLDVLEDDEILLTARALSIHRVSVRRKLDRMKKNTPEYQQTLQEIETTTRCVNKLNAADLQRATA